MRSRFIMTVVASCVLFTAVALQAADRRDYSNSRSLVARVQDDVKRAADFAISQGGSKDKDRYYNAQKHLTTFDRRLTQGKFDKGTLDKVIDNVKGIVDKGTISAQDRDALNVCFRQACANSRCQGLPSFPCGQDEKKDRESGEA